MTEPELDARSRYAVERQEAIYNAASGLIWREAVYKRLHRGWELANLGGLPFLNSIVRRAALDGNSRVLELGSGAGAACQYLAHVSGCRATGIERNFAQLQRAMARSAGSAEAGQLTFILGDITSWRGADDFDTVFLLDTLSLLPDACPALRTAAHALRINGHLFVADLGAGAKVTGGILERAFVEDGFCSLLSVDQMEGLLAHCGFAEVASRDRTGQAQCALRSILEWLEHPPTASGAAPPADAAREWHSVSSFYLDALETRALAYRWWSARPVRAKKTL